MSIKKKKNGLSSYTILFILIIFVAILTWIIPSGSYERQEDINTGKMVPIAKTYVRAEINNPQGLWEIFMAPISGFKDALDIAVFILFIGGFLGVVMKTGAIDAGIMGVMKKLKGHEKLMIPLLVILFSIGGTTYGMAEETIAFYAILIPIFLAAGFDTILAVGTILLGAGAGVLASTVNPFATGIASGFAGISIGQGMGLRVVMLIVLDTTIILFLLRYAAKIKKDITQSAVYENYAADKEHFVTNENIQEITKAQKGVLWVFCLTFLVMTLSVIPWKGALFSNMTQALHAIPVIGNMLGNMVPLGEWWFNEMSMLFLIASIIVGFVYKMGEREFITEFLAGAQDLLPVSLTVVVARGITIIMDGGGITDTILNVGENALAQMSGPIFTNIAYLFYIAMSFVIPSTSGLATLTMPIVAPLAEFANVSKDIIVTAYQSASGIVNLITPTSGVVMGALAIARVPYNVWLKFVMKLIGVIFLLTIILLSIGVMI